MVIVSWNCNGALRTKLQVLRDLGADVYVIQECEDPALAKSGAYSSWASNYLWVGPNKYRGLGIFAKPGISLKQVDLDPGRLQSFLPCRINDQIMLLAVWARQANSPTFRYIGQMWKYLKLHRAVLSHGSTLVLGDFNSNVRWDVWDRWWNHSDVVRELEEIGIHSLYHRSKRIAQGAESEPTFYMHRNLAKPYHIDYAFVSSQWLDSSTVEVGLAENWLAHSDHMPLRVQLLPSPLEHGEARLSTDG